MTNTVNTPVTMNCEEVFTALEAWINQRPGLEYGNYGNMSSYRAELRSIANDKKRALKALDEARNLTPRPEVLADAFSAFSGRLQWDGKQLDYCTGQYWPTEYRKAAASVLERYIAGWKQAEAADNPPVFTYHTMDDVIAANKSIGNHFFDRDTMRFFKCRIESGLVSCDWTPATETEPARARKGRFITSEKGPDEVRRYTIREAQPDGTIDSIGEFGQYDSLKAARAALLK